jgi:hypothetical protein
MLQKSVRPGLSKIARNRLTTKVTLLQKWVTSGVGNEPEDQLELAVKPSGELDTTKIINLVRDLSNALGDNNRRPKHNRKAEEAGGTAGKGLPRRLCSKP